MSQTCSTDSLDIDSMTSISLPHNPPPASPAIDSQGVGLSNPHLSQAGRRMLDLVNRLHSTGVQVDIDLPQIAVIGAQSAGKSSLIESISGITLPRAAGTCTRCPTECRLSRSTGAWKCTVSLRTLENGKSSNEQFGDIITDKAQVEERIRRAQRAILNPTTRKHKGSKYYLTDYDETMELSFSTDYVSLQISGPDVADLSFCDLPGLIAGVGMSGNAKDIELVKGLVSSYIKRPSTIILLTVACETDFQNQGAQELAKKHDPEGKRTIGVLTKPDRIPTGEESNWTGFVKNEKEPLENGWFCVKQPASQDLKAGISWVEARQREDDFFKLTVPWSELDSTYQKYLRTGNLVERLSAILSDLISKRTIQYTRELINKLPKAPSSDPSNEITNLLYKFIRDLSRHVEGVPDKDGLLQTIRPDQEEFRRAVRSTAPEFLPFERRYAWKKALAKPEFLSSEEESDDFIVEASENPQYDSDLPFVPSTIFDEPCSPVHLGLQTDECDYKAMPASQSPSPVPVPAWGVTVSEPLVRPRPDLLDGQICVDEVLERAHQARTRELPGNYPFVVQETYIKAFTKEWGAPAHQLCKAVFSTLQSHVIALVKLHFASFGQGQLEQRVKVHLNDHLNQCMERTKERIDWLLELEDRPFTLNTHYLSDYKDKFLSHYKGAREKDRNANFMKAILEYNPQAASVSQGGAKANRNSFQPPPAFPTGIAKVLSGLVEAGVIGTKPEDLAKLIPPDGMDPALNIMADVRAYFQVAYKRFADNIPLAIDQELVRGIERNILQTLYGGLGINGNDGQQICREMAQENPSVASRREELTKKLERMQAASQELLHI